MRDLATVIKSFILLFLPVAIAILGFVIRPSHPALGYALLAVAGVWMVVAVVHRHRASA
jgi:membrane protein YdbS with pleckstrin-like domain